MSFFEDASLVLIPSGIKNQKIYSIKPTDGTGDLTFTRASNATRVASNGLIEKVRTNLLTYSQDFSNAAWLVDAGLTKTLGQTDPNGGTTAALFSGTSGSNLTIGHAVTLTANVPNTISIWIKGASNGSVSLRIDDSTTGPQYDINYTTSWQRFSVTKTVDQNSCTFVVGGYFTWGVGENIYLAFGQAETGDIATDYIATTSAAVSVGPVSGLPRLDYLNSSCPRLLLEPQRTNYQTNSEDFDNWYAPNDGVTLSENTSDTLDPSGYNGATKVTTAGGNQRVYDIVSIPAGSSTYSVFVKAGTGSLFTLFTSNAAFSVSFNLSTQSVTATIGSGTITSYGNGWYRCTATGTTPSGDVIQLLFPNSVGQTTYIWGAQWEAGAYATSYIPTLGTSVTRVADAASKTGISSLIGQTEGTLFVEFKILALGQQIAIITSAAGNEINRLQVYVNDAGRIGLYRGDASVNILSPSSALYTVGSTIKIAAAYKLNDYALYVNGVQVGTDTSASIPPNPSVLYLSQYVDGTASAGAHSQALVFKTRLTNAQLAELTTL